MELGIEDYLLCALAPSWACCSGVLPGPEHPLAGNMWQGGLAGPIPRMGRGNEQTVVLMLLPAMAGGSDACVWEGRCPFQQLFSAYLCFIQRC